MLRTFRLLLAAVFSTVAVLSALPDPAAAEPSRATPYANPILPSLDVVATEYWGARGYTLPAIEVFVVSEVEAEDAGAEGVIGGPGVWLTPWAIREFLAADEPWEVSEIFCVMWLHERGHNAGLSHHVGWAVMHQRAYFSPPPRCRTWAKSLPTATER